MIFKTPNTFPVYTVSIRPGKVAYPYLGESNVTFDHYPEMKEVLKALVEQDRAYDKSVRKWEKQLGEKLYREKSREGKLRFRQLVIETLKRIGLPKFTRHASSVSSYDKGPFKENNRQPACVSVSRMWVKRREP